MFLFHIFRQKIKMGMACPRVASQFMMLYFTISSSQFNNCCDKWVWQRLTDLRNKCFSRFISSYALYLILNIFQFSLSYIIVQKYNLPILPSSLILVLLCLEVHLFLKLSYPNLKTMLGINSCKTRISELFWSMLYLSFG